MDEQARSRWSPPERHPRERAVEVAVELLDRQGLAALSMRRLAAAVGVPTSTLYGYFRSKDELIDAVVDRLNARSPLPTLQGSWRDRLRDLMRWLAVGLARHPDLVKLRLGRPMLSPGALRLTDAGIGVLLEAGFPPREASFAYRSLFVYTFGWAAFGPHGSSDEDERRTRAAITLLPPEDYPALTASITEAAAAMSGREPFEYGLERLLDGLEENLRALTRPVR